MIIEDKLKFTPDGMSKGYEDRPVAYGDSPYAKTLDIPLIPRDEWKDRIADKERNKTRLSDLCKSRGLSVLNQNGTNFCWANGPVHCMEILRLSMGQDMVRLSPASIACPITNYRNQGGWGEKSLGYIIKHGACPQSMWPANAIDRRYENNESRAERAKYRVTEWYDCKPRSLDELATCLILGFPASVAYNHWRHLVTAVDLVYERDQWGVRIRNSWGANWGDNGEGVLLGSKAIPDECLIPRVAVAA